jgi:hypothetical protein
VAAKVMKSILAESKDLRFAEPTVRIHAALNDESRAQIAALASELSA